jgi:ubiquinone biosynthesis protein
MFHADLHPANLMILPGNVVGYIDFGITGVLSRHSRRHLVAMTLAYTRGDLDAMCDAFFEVSALGPGSDPAGFRRGIDRLSQTWYSGDGAGRRLSKNFTLVMLDMLRLSRATRILPERSVVKYIRSSIAIDGLITRFCPGFDVGGYLADVCASYLARRPPLAGLSATGVVDWAAASSRLARDGGLRMARLLDRVSVGELPLRAEVAAPPPAAGASTGPLGLFVLATALLMAWGDAPPSLGLNLFTAEAFLMVAGLAILALRIGRPFHRPPKEVRLA